ncbi:MAG TPA: multiheme c-type cytochrome [Candidatus Deferrimicrobiaceae bacterium]
MNRVLLIAGAALLLLPSHLRAAPARTGPFRSAAVCAECHPESYRTWRSSRHASASTDPAYRIPCDRIVAENAPRAIPCEQCHNPMRSLLSPRDPRAVHFSREGVTCDFCHAVPHATSEFCAGCHEYRNEHGAPILTTASEWEESVYRGTGVHCQSCHFPRLSDASSIGGKRRIGPVDHAMAGGQTRERLSGAIPIRAQLLLSGSEARVLASVRNERVGHATPGGLPAHRIRLTATIHDAAGNDLGRREEVFERVLGDGKGKPLTNTAEIFLDAREVLKDNRIRPKESRQVRFSFPLDNGVPAAALVSLAYEMQAPGAAPALRHVATPIAEKVVIAEAAGFRGKAVILLAAAVLAILVWAAFRKKRPA